MRSDLMDGILGMGWEVHVLHDDIEGFSIQ